MTTRIASYAVFALITIGAVGVADVVGCPAVVYALLALASPAVWRGVRVALSEVARESAPCRWTLAAVCSVALVLGAAVAVVMPV